MGSGSLRPSSRWLIKPPFPEHLSDLEIRNAATARIAIVAIAVVIDVFVFATLRGEPSLRGEVLLRFTAINVSLLSLDLVLTALLLRRPGRWTRPLQAVCIVLEAFTLVFWIQVTGSVSSYFIAAGVMFVLGYRLFFDYRMALLALGAVWFFHAGAFALEELGWLRPASLFTSEPSGIYGSPAFRQAAMVSILACDAAVFLIGNAVVLKLREKESALRVARARLLQVVQESQLGRLSGSVLAARYQLREVLGRGGMGEVYAARRLSDDQPVAVKVLHGHLSGDPRTVARLQREVEVAQRLPAGMAAEVLELGRGDDGQHFIAMELLEGEDLSALLRRRKRLDPDELRALAAGIAAILDAAHALGVVHRDLKPGNVFLTAGPAQLRLLDFGIARLLEHGGGATLTGADTVLGSPGYLAPEQALALAEKIGPATDTFALGAILYRAATGESAFPSRSASGAIHEALYWQPPPPSTLRAELPDAVDAVLRIALAKDCATRFASAGELARAFDLALDGQLPEALRDRAAALSQGAPVDATLSRA